MSDHDFTDEDLDNEAIPAGLRAAARAGRAAQAEAAKAKRELLFARAGIDLESEDPRVKKLSSVLFDTFSGETLAELKAEAETFGILGAPKNEAPTKTDAEIEAEAQAAHRANLGSASGKPAGESTGTEGAHPMTSALTSFHQEVKQGAQPDEARHKAIATVMNAGFAGDKRVAFDQGAHYRRAQELEGTSAYA